MHIWLQLIDPMLEEYSDQNLALEWSLLRVASLVCPMTQSTTPSYWKLQFTVTLAHALQQLVARGFIVVSEVPASDLQCPLLGGISARIPRRHSHLSQK